MLKIIVFHIVTLGLLTQISFAADTSKQVIECPLNQTHKHLTTSILSLLPIARGVSSKRPEDLWDANIKLLEIGNTYGSYPQRFSNENRTEIHDILKHEPIKTIKPFNSAGFNDVYMVEFQTGHKAIFKPFFGQKNLGKDKTKWRARVALNREYSAKVIIEDFFKNASSRQMGLSNLIVPPTEEVLLVHDGTSYGLGTVQIFLENHNMVYFFMRESPEEWATFESSPEWQKIEGRIRTIDYMMGNPDRLPNPGYHIEHYEMHNFCNLIYPGTSLIDCKHFALIDNAIGRPGPYAFDEAFAPDVKSIPDDLAEAILDFDTQKFRSFFVDILPQAGINDVLERVRYLQIKIIETRQKDDTTNSFNHSLLNTK